MTGYVTRAELQAMVDACPAGTLAGKRDRLLLVILRALNGRSGEVAALRIADVTADPDTGFNVTVRPRSPGSNGWPVHLTSIPAGEYTEHDPCVLFINWESALALDTALRPLFLAITKDDRLQGPRGLTPASISGIVKRAATRAGLEHPERYNARRLRSPARRKVDQP